jgi:integrase
VTSAEIDGWILSLEEEKGLSSATINKILQTMRLLLDGAVRQGMIRLNPAKAVEPLSVRHEERGVLTDEEIRGLLRWPGPFRDYRVYTMNLLAFCTGLRIGEARGLMMEDVQKDHLVIRHSWEERYGIKPPENERSRAVPLPEQAKKALQKVIADFQPASLVFYGRSPSTPLSKSYVLNGLRDANVTMKLNGDPRTLPR